MYYSINFLCEFNLGLSLIVLVLCTQFSIFSFSLHLGWHLRFAAVKHRVRRGLLIAREILLLIPWLGYAPSSACIAPILTRDGLLRY